MRRRGKHVVVTADGEWTVRDSGGIRAGRRKFKSRDAAIKFARILSERDRIPLYVHRTDGSVESKVSFETEETH